MLNNEHPPYITFSKKYNGSTVREMKGVEEYLQAALQNLISKIKLVLEGQNSAVILDEPDNSPQLRHFMTLETNNDS